MRSRGWKSASARCAGIEPMLVGLGVPGSSARGAHDPLGHDVDPQASGARPAVVSADVAMRELVDVLAGALGGRAHKPPLYLRPAPHVLRVGEVQRDPAAVLLDVLQPRAIVAAVQDD